MLYFNIVNFYIFKFDEPPIKSHTAFFSRIGNNCLNISFVMEFYLNFIAITFPQAGFGLEYLFRYKNGRPP